MSYSLIGDTKSWKICHRDLLHVNFYGANTEKEELVTLTKLSEMLNSILNI